MKTAKLAAIYVTALILIGNTLAPAEDQEEKNSQRPYVGVRLDPNPLPELLTKHLKLKANQGLLVYNVQVDSPADKAGVERDDIIVGFQGKDVTGYDDFVSDIRSEGVGTKIELKIIHEGDRLTKKLTLAPFEQTNNWKYPFRKIPRVQRTPNRIFRMNPGDQWRQIPYEGLPEEIQPFFKHEIRKRVYRVQTDDVNVKITIEDGGPNNLQPKIEVHDLENDARYRISHDKIDTLPEKYRDLVRDALKEKKKEDRQWGWDFHFEFPPNLRKFDDDPLIVPNPYQGRDIEKYRDELRRDIEKWQKDSLRDLNKRLEKMEKNNRRLHEQMEKMFKEKQGEDKEHQDKESHERKEHEDDSDSL